MPIPRLLRALKSPAAVDTLPGWEDWVWEQQIQLERLVAGFRFVLAILITGAWLVIPLPATAAPALVGLSLAVGWAYILAALWIYWRQPALGRRCPYCTAYVDLLLVLVWVWLTGGTDSDYSLIVVAGAVTMPLRVPLLHAVVGSLAYGTLYLLQGTGTLKDLLGAIFLSVVGVFLALHVAMIRQQQLENIRDPLTGCFGRAYGLFCLQRLLRDRTTPCAVALIDLDGFKQINDTRGHVVGDEMLVECARAMMNHVRAQDVLCRYGGDEFLLVLPGLDADTAGEVVERLRNAMAALDIRPRDTEAAIGVTISAGVVAAGGETDPMRLLAAADSCLYLAKRTRNRVVVTQHPA